MKSVYKHLSFGYRKPTNTEIENVIIGLVVSFVKSLDHLMDSNSFNGLSIHDSNIGNSY